MSEGAVCLRHLVSVVALLDRVALSGSRVFEFGRQRIGHRHAAAAVGVLNDPAHRERNLARRRYFHRHLIGGATDSAGFYFEARTDILPSPVDDLERINRVRTLARFIDRGINDPLPERPPAALPPRRNA